MNSIRMKQVADTWDDHFLLCNSPHFEFSPYTIPEYKVSDHSALPCLMQKANMSVCDILENFFPWNQGWIFTVNWLVRANHAHSSWHGRRKSADHLLPHCTLGIRDALPGWLPHSQFQTCELAHPLSDSTDKSPKCIIYLFRFWAFLARLTPIMMQQWRVLNRKGRSKSYHCRFQETIRIHLDMKEHKKHRSMSNVHTWVWFSLETISFYIRFHLISVSWFAGK